MRYYTSVISLSVITLITLIVLIYYNSRFDRKTKKALFLSYGTLITAAFTELMSSLLNGAPMWTLHIHQVMKCMDYVFSPMAGFFIVIQFADQNRLKFQYLPFMAANAAVEIMSIFTGWTFYVDENNYYHHGPLHYIYMGVCLLTLAFVAFEFFSYSRRFRRNNLLSLWMTGAMLLVGVALQEFTNDIRTCILAEVFAVMLLVMHINDFEQQIDVERMREKDWEIVTDTLTGVSNRMAFDVKTEEYFRKFPHHHCVAIMADIDDFRRFNDTCGHEVGDEALKVLADNICRVMPSGAWTGRITGNEFGILLRNTTAKKAEPLVQKLSRMDQTFLYNGREYSFTISVGFAESMPYDDDRGGIFGMADDALCYVKVRGKNGYKLFSEDVRRVGRKQLGSALRELSVNLPGAFIIYKVGEERRDLIFASHELLRICRCEGLAEFMQYTGGTFEGMVHPGDLERVERSLRKQSAAAGTDGISIVDYRLVTSKGDHINVTQSVRVTDSPENGRVAYALMVENRLRAVNAGS